MGSAIIAAIVAIAGAAIEAGVSNKQNKQARAEARSISDLNARLDQKQTNVDTALSTKSLGLQKQTQQINEQNTNYEMNKTKQEANDYLNTSNRQALTQSASKVLGQNNQEESFLYKRSLLNRIG